MSQYFQLHADNPQPRLIREAVKIIQDGGVVVYPTDSCYALGCHLGDKAAADRLRKIRGLDDKHHLTLVCRDLAELGTYARVDNQQFRTLKMALPGPYTFILAATKEVPKRLVHPKKSTIGLRVPEHPVVHALLEALGEPLLSSSLLLPDEPWPLNDGWAIRERLEREVDAILDAGPCALDPTSVIDLSEGGAKVLRAGRGDLARLGLEMEE